MSGWLYWVSIACFTKHLFYILLGELSNYISFLCVDKYITMAFVVCFTISVISLNPLL